MGPRDEAQLSATPSVGTMATPSVTAIPDGVGNHMDMSTGADDHDNAIGTGEPNKRSERKRQREKQRRFDLSNAFDELASFIALVEPESAEAELEVKKKRKKSEGEDTSGSTRLDVIGKALRIMKRLHHENEERKGIIASMHDRGGPNEKVMVMVPTLAPVGEEPYPVARAAYPSSYGRAPASYYPPTHSGGPPPPPPHPSSHPPSHPPGQPPMHQSNPYPPSHFQSHSPGHGPPRPPPEYHGSPSYPPSSSSSWGLYGAARPPSHHHDPSLPESQVQGMVPVSHGRGHRPPEHPEKR